MVAWLGLLACLALYFWLISRAKGKPMPVELALRVQILRRLRGPVGDAESILERSLLGVRRRFPGKDETWYLRRVLADLDHDRR